MRTRNHSTCNPPADVLDVRLAAPTLGRTGEGPVKVEQGSMQGQLDMHGQYELRGRMQE